MLVNRRVTVSIKLSVPIFGQVRCLPRSQTLGSEAQRPNHYTTAPRWFRFYNNSKVVQFSEQVRREHPLEPTAIFFPQCFLSKRPQRFWKFIKCCRFSPIQPTINIWNDFSVTPGYFTLSAWIASILEFGTFSFRPSDVQNSPISWERSSRTSSDGLPLIGGNCICGASVREINLS